MSRILMICNTPWEQWINYSPGYWLSQQAAEDPDVDLGNIHDLKLVDLSQYDTVIINDSLDWWQKNEDRWNLLFKNHIKWHIRNDLHSHNEKHQKIQELHASYVDWITSAYPLSIEESDIDNNRKGGLIPFQANCVYRNKLVRLPHAILSTFNPITTPLKDRNKQAIITGHMRSDVYPWRNNMRDNCICEDLAHPGYKMNNFKHKVIHQEYINLLGQYRVSFADGGTVNYVVNKYFEVCFAGCILICKYIPELELLGHKDGETCFFIDNPKLANALIRDIERNPELYQDIATAGQQLVINRHTAQIRWQEFKQMIREKELEKQNTRWEKFKKLIRIENRQEVDIPSDQIILTNTSFLGY